MTETIVNIVTVDDIPTLAVPCGPTDTELTLSRALPDAPTFRLRIDNEYVRVDDVNGAVVTVVRGDDGSTPAAHVEGAQAIPTVNRAALYALRADAKRRTTRTLNAPGPIQATDDYCGLRAAGTFTLPAPDELVDGQSWEFVDETGATSPTSKTSIDGNGLPIELYDGSGDGAQCVIPDARFGVRVIFRGDRFVLGA